MSPRPSDPINLEHILLALLDNRPMHGYELYQELCAEPGISLIWNIKQGMLYAMLEKLETHQLVSARIILDPVHPPRKEFSLTPAGRQSLHEWMTQPVRRPRMIRQEFLARLIVARRYGPEPALKLIHVQRMACLDWLDNLRANFPPRNDDRVDEWLVYSYRVSRLECVLDWLHTCEMELAREHPVT